MGIKMFVPAPEYVQVVEPAPPDPFATSVRPIETLLQFGTPEALGHEVHVQGVLTAQRERGHAFRRGQQTRSNCPKRRSLAAPSWGPARHGGFRDARHSH